MTPFVPSDFPVPAGLTHPDFTLRMLSVADARADYAAVMASAARLRAGSPHGWPRPGFTLEENIADLTRHQQEFLDREAFAYTVLAPDAATVLGCVYINPTTEPPPDDASVAAAAADVYLWIRDEHHPALTGRLFAAVDGWLQSQWPFSRVRYVRREYYLDDTPPERDA